MDKLPADSDGNDHTHADSHVHPVSRGDTSAGLSAKLDSATAIESDAYAVIFALGGVSPPGTAA
jgi:hypothetical protein